MQQGVACGKIDAALLLVILRHFEVLFPTSPMAGLPAPIIVVDRHGGDEAQPPLSLFEVQVSGEDVPLGCRSRVLVPPEFVSLAAEGVITILFRADAVGRR